MHTTPFWHRKIGDLVHQSAVQLVQELCMMRSTGGFHYTPDMFESSTLFNFTQSCFRRPDRKPHRWTSDYTVSAGILETKVHKLECETLKQALAEMGSWKNPPLPLPLYENKKLLTFLNDYFANPKRPKLFPL